MSETIIDVISRGLFFLGAGITLLMLGCVTLMVFVGAYCVVNCVMDRLER